MEATIGDRICLRGNIVGHPDKHGEIVEVHGDGGEPPYLVRFEDGQTRLLFPGPDAVIEHIPQQRRGHLSHGHRQRSVHRQRRRRGDRVLL